VWAHGRVWIEHNNTEAKSFGLTAANDERGKQINVRVRGWWDYPPPCIAVMEKYNVVQSIITSFKPY
jgi:hypothetical protein